MQTKWFIWAIKNGLQSIEPSRNKQMGQEKKSINIVHEWRKMETLYLFLYVFIHTCIAQNKNIKWWERKMQFLVSSFILFLCCFLSLWAAYRLVYVLQFENDYHHTDWFLLWSSSHTGYGRVRHMFFSVCQILLLTFFYTKIKNAEVCYHCLKIK